MEYTHITGVFSLLQALATGVVLGIYYDAFRLLRRVARFDPVSVMMQDLIFWVTSAVFVFFICVRLNNGYIRIYFVLLAMLGWLIYFLTAGKLAFFVFDGFLRFLNLIFEKIKHSFFHLSYHFYSKIRFL